MVTDIDYCGRNLVGHTEFIEKLGEDPRYKVTEVDCIGKCEECPYMYIVRAYEPTWIRGARHTIVATEGELPAAFERTMHTSLTSRIARAAVQRWENRNR